MAGLARWGGSRAGLLFDTGDFSGHVEKDSQIEV